MEQVGSAIDVAIHQIDWARDGKSIMELDTSFSTTRIYQLCVDGLKAEFTTAELSEPLTKRYDISDVKEAIDESALALVAKVENKLAAFITMKFESWNRRSWITNLYVAPEYRGGGIGKRLFGEALGCSLSKNARGVWVETQNVNYPAIQFYSKLGFEFCGFDRSLYDPAVVPGETAIYFSLDLSRTNSKRAVTYTNTYRSN